MSAEPVTQTHLEEQQYLMGLCHAEADMDECGLPTIMEHAMMHALKTQPGTYSPWFRGYMDAVGEAAEWGRLEEEGGK